MMSPTSLDLSTSVRSELSGHFLVWEPVQRGPFSTAFTAHNARGGDRVLLHVVLRSALDRAGLTDQFHEALTAAAALNHPGIVRVLASGATASFEWYSTQPVEPRMRLSSILNARGPVTGKALIALVEQTAAVLSYAHHAGVSHGHLSPSTVFLHDEGRVCVSEFCTRRILYLLRESQHRPGTRRASDPLAARESLMRHDHLSLALLIHECLAGQALVTTGIESGATGPGAQIPLSDAFGDLEKRLRERGALPEGEARALNQLFSSISEDHRSLPNVMNIAAQLGLQTRNEPEDAVPAAAVAKIDEVHGVDLHHEPAFVFAGQREPPKRHWSLIATVAITVIVTWLALLQVPRMVRSNAPDTPIVARGTTRASDSINARADLPSVSLAVAQAAPPPQPAAPEKRVNPDPPKVTPTARPDSKSMSRTSADSAAPRPVRVGTVATQSAAAKAVKATPDSAKAPVQLPPGNLFISTMPWGYLYVDGALIGNTPATDVSLSVGTHRLRVVRDGFQPYETEITVLPGQRLRLVHIILTR